MWAAVRWQTYHLMAAQVGGRELASKGVHSPKDLMPFDWEKETRIPLSEEEVAESQEEIRQIQEWYNKQNNP